MVFVTYVHCAESRLMEKLEERIPERPQVFEGRSPSPMAPDEVSSSYSIYFEWDVAHYWPPIYQQSRQPLQLAKSGLFKDALHGQLHYATELRQTTVRRYITLG